MTVLFIVLLVIWLTHVFKFHSESPDFYMQEMFPIDSWLRTGTASPIFRHAILHLVMKDQNILCDFISE